MDAVAGRRRWREPTRDLPLRWGRYEDRLGIGLLLIVGGAVCIAGADTFQLLALLATVPHVIGWAILPADGWRRLLVAFPSTLACWLLLTGPKFLAVLAIPFLCWMLVRHRPPLISLLSAVIPVGTAVLIAALARDYSVMLPALGVEAAALAVGALNARALASQRSARRRGDPAA